MCCMGRNDGREPDRRVHRTRVNARGSMHDNLGQRAFAIAPRDFLDQDRAATAAIDAPHGIQEEDEKRSEWINSKLRSASWS